MSATIPPIPSLANLASTFASNDIQSGVRQPQSVIPAPATVAAPIQVFNPIFYNHLENPNDLRYLYQTILSKHSSTSAHLLAQKQHILSIYARQRSIQLQQEALNREFNTTQVQIASEYIKLRELEAEQRNEGVEIGQIMARMNALGIPLWDRTSEELGVFVPPAGFFELLQSSVDAATKRYDSDYGEDMDEDDESDADSEACGFVDMGIPASEVVGDDDIPSVGEFRLGGVSIFDLEK